MDAVSALKQALDVPAAFPLPAAVNNMSVLTEGLPSEKDDVPIALPEQVALLLEVTGVEVTQREVAPEEPCDETPEGPEEEAPNEIKKHIGFQQRAPPPATSPYASHLVCSYAS